MKKIIYAFLFLFIASGITQAQSTKIVKTPFTPSFQILVKGAYSVPLSHQDFKDFTSGFPGAQLELAYDFNPCWGVYGNFSADFVTAKDPVTPPQGVTNYKQASSTQLSGYVGPRYYINLRSAPLWKIFVDAGVGIYSVKPGDITATDVQTPSVNYTLTTSSNSQMGTNLGAGANVVVGSRMVVTFGAKYHFLFKKTGATLTRTLSDGTTTTSDTDSNYTVAERSYLQFNAGIGFRF